MSPALDITIGRQAILPTNGTAGGLTISDTNLYRSAANNLKTDDNFECAGAAKIGGGAQFGGGVVIGAPSTILGFVIVTDNDPRLIDARAPTGPAGGDLTGTYPSPTINPAAIPPTPAPTTYAQLTARCAAGQW